MAKRLTNQQLLSNKIETLSDIEAAQVLEYIDLIESKKKIQPTTTSEDDLIDYLANTPENLCAQQVIEWDKVRRCADVQTGFTLQAFRASNKG